MKIAKLFLTVAMATKVRMQKLCFLFTLWLKELTCAKSKQDPLKKKLIFLVIQFENKHPFPPKSTKFEAALLPSTTNTTHFLF